MNFNEKLIELRKKGGLSQEELGYKLNVSRQTISKWELGQTTPEMDKLIELSKVFNITVDELINNSKTINTSIPKTENRPVSPNNNKVKKEKHTKVIIITFLLIILMLIVLKICALIPAFSIFNKVYDQANKTTNMQNDILGKIVESFENNNLSNSTGVDGFNNQISDYQGTQIGTVANKTLDTAITINNTQDRKLTVQYNNIETQDVDEIKNIKQYLNNFDSYEISFKYDDDGYIYKVILENAKSDFNLNTAIPFVDPNTTSINNHNLSNMLDDILE